MGYAARLRAALRQAGTRVSPSPVGLDTGARRGDGQKVSVGLEGGEGRTGAGEGEGAGGGQAPAQQAWAGKRNKVPAKRVVLATGKRCAVRGQAAR